MSELADAVLVEPHSLTKLIDKMVAEGLVFRLPDDHDRRKVLVSLAEDGRSIIPKLRKCCGCSRSPHRHDDYSQGYQGA